MSINGNISDYNETKSLKLNSYHKQVEILSNTINLLNEQIDSNNTHMMSLEKKLHRLGVKATYHNDTKYIELLYEHNLDQDIRSKAEAIVKEYNAYYSRNESIKENIMQLKNNFMALYSDDEILDIIEKTGISILRAQERERNRIAADLHDSIVQNLVNLMHKSELCIHEIGKDPINVKLELQMMIQSIRTIIDDIRSIIYNLRPMAFDDLGLEVAIGRFVKQFLANNNVNIEFYNDCRSMDTIDPVISLTLFRIIQEACSNAVRHGSATKIEMRISDTKGAIHLDIIDNGQGFEVKDQHSLLRNDNSGFGLSIMKERIFLLSGKIMINSRHGLGTSIHIEIPIIKC